MDQLRTAGKVAGAPKLMVNSQKVPSPPPTKTFDVPELVYRTTVGGLGGPAFSIPLLTLYVSDTSGKVHGIPWPIP